MKKSTTPEEKLLRLIKSKSPTQRRPEGIKKEPVDSDAKNKPYKPPAALKVKDGAKFVAGNLSKIMIFLLIGVVVYLAIDSLLITPFYRYRIGKMDYKVSTDKVQKEAKDATAQDENAAESKKPYSYYSNDIASRDIFKPLVQKEKKAVGDNFKQIRESLGLIGIITGEKLQAAIEDRKTKKTYFVYKGEHINDILVEDVLENKVILNYKGETFELML